MSEANEVVELKGSCLCGAVHFVAVGAKVEVGACHCSMCSKWGGGPLMAVDGGKDVKFEGEQHISIYNSSQWAERGFCSQCGSHLFYRIKGEQQYIIPVGSLDEAKGLIFDHQIFIDEKPEYYDFANDTEKMTGAEVMAMYMPATE